MAALEQPAEGLPDHPQARLPDVDTALADVDAAGDEDAWPGVAPPAGWFLRPRAGTDTPAANVAASPATADAGAGPAIDNAEASLAEDAEDGGLDEWFAPLDLEPAEDPISWCQDLNGLEGEEQPSAPAEEEPDEPVTEAPVSERHRFDQHSSEQLLAEAAAAAAIALGTDHAAPLPLRDAGAARPATPPPGLAIPLPDEPPGHGIASNGHRPVPPEASSPARGGAGSGNGSAPAEPVVGATRALQGRAGGPGFQPRRPGPGHKRATAALTSWQKGQRLWSESGIQWEHHLADSAQQPHLPATGRVPHRGPDAHPLSPHGDPAPLVPPPPRPRNTKGRRIRLGSFTPQPVTGAWPSPVPLSAPVFAGTGPDTGTGTEPDTGTGTEPQTGLENELGNEPENESVNEPPALQDQRRASGGLVPLWNHGYDPGRIPAAHQGEGRDTALLEPELPDGSQPATRYGRFSRRPVAIAVPVIVLAAVAVLAVSLLTGHGPKFGQLAANRQANQEANQQGSQQANHQGNPQANQQGNQQGDQQAPQGTAPQSPLTIGMYPGQQQRGVFQTINRVVASGNTVVTMGSQTSDGVVRQQFFVSTDGGASWRLAALRAAGGGQPPVGYPAARLAGGPGGWIAVGPQATWTSPDGLSWTLAATHSITPQLPGDQMWVLNSTAQGFLAAGVGSAGGSATQAVIWTSRDGLTWQRKTAAQLGLAGPGETVQSISYITARAKDTVISGTVARGGTTYSGTWLSTDGGSTWTRVTVPVDHGAGTSITGLAFDGSGLIAVRPGRAANGTGDGVAYFSPNGQAWQYAGTIDAAGGWSPTLVKGSDYGFVVTGASATAQILAFTSAGTGTVWQPTASLGDAGKESVVGATVGPAGTMIAIGYTAGSKVSQQPVFLEANTAGSVRPVSLAGLPGATVPELAVNGLAISGGQQVAVGSADGYPAVWRKASGGSWDLVSSLSQVFADTGLSALTGVTHGSAGWLAVGAPGPVVFTSADGTAWQRADGPGSITDDLAGVSAVAAAAGPAGYVIVGKLVGPGGSCVADVWWSPNLTSWTRAHDVNDVSGSSQVLAVAADAHGFVSVGSHNGKPAVWTTTDGRSWTTIVLPVPAGASSAVLQQVAINGDRVAALGQETTAGGSVPFAELSVNGGTSWRQVPFSPAGPGTTFTALTADSGGFTAAGQFGEPGQRRMALWTSTSGATWTQSLTGGRAGGSYQVTALAPSGSAVTGIGSISTGESQDVFTATVPAR